jgi:hypothetical protein
MRATMVDGREPGPVAASPPTAVIESRRLSDVLTELETAIATRPESEPLVLRDLLVVAKRQSYPILVLVFSLLLVSPLSAIPFATTILGLSIATIVAQQLLGRERVWLPAVLLDRTLPRQRTLQALSWLQRPVGWLEGHLRMRFGWAFVMPLCRIPLALVLAASLCAPLMEVIPGSGTSVGAAISVFSAGLLARDGLFVVAGASLAALLPLGLWLLIT